MHKNTEATATAAAVTPVTAANPTPATVVDFSKEKALCEAVIARKNAEVSELLNAGANPTTSLSITGSSERMNPIMLAARYGHGDTLCILLKKLEEIVQYNQTVYKIPKEEVEKFSIFFKAQALFQATHYGKDAIARILLAAGADLRAKTTEGLTALMYAACMPIFWQMKKPGVSEVELKKLQDSYETLFRFFIEHHVDLACFVPLRGNVLHVILETGTLNMLSSVSNGNQMAPAFDLQVPEAQKSLNIMLKRTDTEGRKILGYLLGTAAEKGDIELLATFMKLGVDCSNAVDEKGQKLLFNAVHSEQTKPVKWLLKHGAEVNPVRKSDGETPLTVAALLGCPRMVKLLVKSGANPDAVAFDGSTALLNAIKVHDCDDPSSLEVVDILAKVCPIDAVDIEGESALSLAAGSGDGPLVKLLMDNGANTNFKTKDGNTPLMVAVRAGHLDVVRLLVPETSLSAVDTGGNSACSLACDLEIKERNEILKILLTSKIKRMIKKIKNNITIDKKWMTNSFLPLLVSTLIELDVMLTREDNFSLDPQRFAEGIVPLRILHTLNDVSVLKSGFEQMLDDFSLVRDEDKKSTDFSDPDIHNMFKIRVQKALWIRSTSGVRNNGQELITKVRTLENRFVGIRSVFAALMQEVENAFLVISMDKKTALAYLETIKTQSSMKPVRLNKQGNPRNSSNESGVYLEKEKKELEELGVANLENRFNPIRTNFEQCYALNHEKIACLFYAILEEDYSEIDKIINFGEVSRLMRDLEKFIAESKHMHESLQVIMKTLADKKSQFENRIEANTKKVQKKLRDTDRTSKETRDLEDTKKRAEVESAHKKMMLEKEKEREAVFAKARQEALAKYKEKRIAEKKKEEERKRVMEKTKTGEDKKKAVDDKSSDTTATAARQSPYRKPRRRELTLEDTTQLIPVLQMEEKKIILEKIFKWLNDTSQPQAMTAALPDTKVDKERSIYLMRIKRNAILCTIAQLMETIQVRKGGHWFPVELANDLRNFIFHAVEENALLSLNEDVLTKVQKMAVELYDYLATPKIDINVIQSKQDRAEAVKKAIKSSLFQAIILEQEKGRPKPTLSPNSATATDKQEGDLLIKTITQDICKKQIAHCEQEIANYTAYQAGASEIPSFIVKAALDFSIARRGAFEADFRDLYPKEYDEYVKRNGGWGKHKKNILKGRIVRHNKFSLPETAATGTGVVTASATASVNEEESGTSTPIASASGSGSGSGSGSKPASPQKRSVQSTPESSGLSSNCSTPQSLTLQSRVSSANGSPNSGHSSPAAYVPPLMVQFGMAKTTAAKPVAAKPAAANASFTVTLSAAAASTAAAQTPPPNPLPKAKAFRRLF